MAFTLMKKDILEQTLAAAVRDQQTVTDAGVATVPIIEGVSFRETVAQHDDRGTLVELYDTRWTWHPEPLLYVYSFTLEPGVVKGWALHKEHEDRYFVIEGKMEVVLFDPRPDSSTYGKVSRIVLSADRPRLMNIPRFVWHADHNFTVEPARGINFPTTCYNHANPDKYRLPIDTPLIPFSFDGARGW
jgi:dTDP-4-dehydrorhamnose 3,5-epimerase